MVDQKNIINQAEKFCADNQERLTKPRLEVLKIFAKSSQPLGAYDVLEKLGEIISSPKPPTVYRAIEFWQKKGFIHRIESLNAYVACQEGHRHKGAQFMICDDCGVVIETHVHDLPKMLKTNTASKTFTPSSWNVEIHGLCNQCELN